MGAADRSQGLEAGTGGDRLAGMKIGMWEGVRLGCQFLSHLLPPLSHQHSDSSSRPEPQGMPFLALPSSPPDCPSRPPSPLTSCPRPARRKDRRRPAHAPHTAEDKYFPGNGTCSLCVYSQGPGRVGGGEGPARGTSSSPGAHSTWPGLAPDLLCDSESVPTSL